MITLSKSLIDPLCPTFKLRHIRFDKLALATHKVFSYTHHCWEHCSLFLPLIFLCIILKFLYLYLTKIIEKWDEVTMWKGKCFECDK